MEIETKYNLNQEVWFIENAKATKDVILKIVFSKDKSCEEIEYHFKDGFGMRGSTYRRGKENRVFATKEELINSL